MKYLIGIACVVLLPLCAMAEESKIPWLTDFAEAQRQAEASGKLIFADIFATWCPPCKMLEQYTFSDDATAKRLEAYIPVKLDADKESELVMRYSDGSLPTLVVIEPNGAIVDYEEGFKTVEQLDQWLTMADTKLARMRSLAGEVGTSPQDAEKALQLAELYRSARRYTAAAEVLAALSPDTLGALPAETQGDVLWNLALARFGAEDFEGGVAAIEKLVLDHADYSRADTAAQLLVEGRYLASMHAMEQGEYDKAKAGFAKITELVDTYPDLAGMATRQLQVIALIGQPAPEIDASAWVHGDALNLADLRGQVVMIEFFQVVCPACESMRPSIERLLGSYGDQGLRVFGVATSIETQAPQDPQTVEEYTQIMDFQYPVAVDNGSASTFGKYAAQGAPWVVLIARDGTVAYSGYFREGPVEAQLKALLGTGAKSS